MGFALAQANVGGYSQRVQHMLLLRTVFLIWGVGERRVRRTLGDLHANHACNDNRDIKLSRHCLKVGERSREVAERKDIPISKCRQRDIAEVDHVTDHLLSDPQSDVVGNIEGIGGAYLDDRINERPD